MSSFFGDIEQGRKAVDYWQVARHYSFSILLIVSLASMIGYLIGSSIPPQYRSTAKLMIKPTMATKSESMGLPQIPFNMSSLYLTQLELIRSRPISESVIEKLRLINHPDFTNVESNPIRSLISSLFGDMAVKTIYGAVSPKTRKFNRSSDLVPYFNDRLSVTSGGKSDLINISYDSGDPKIAASISNEIAIHYIEALNKAHKSNIDETIGWLSNKLDAARKSLIDSEAKLRIFQRKSSVLDSVEERKMHSGKIGSISGELLRARTSRANLEIRVKQLKAIEHNFDALESIKEIIEDPNYRLIKEQESTQSRVVLELSQKYGHKHPKLQAAKNELEHLQIRKKREMSGVVRRLEQELSSAIAHEAQLARLFSELQSEAQNSKGVEFEQAKLEMEVATNKEIYDLLLTRMKEADINKNTSLVDVKVIEPAHVPGAPFKPNVGNIVGTAAILGFVFGFIIALLRDSSDTTFKTGEDLVDHLGVPLLGVFPKLSRKELFGYVPERIVAERPRSSISESVNNIRTNIIFGASNDPPQVIMVTSAVAGEGKTTISNNLAIALSRLGPTLLLEVDTRRPRMAALLRNRTKSGVFEFVTGKANLKDCVVPERRVKNLYTMPVIAKPAKPIEFLSSKKFRKAIDVLRTKFKYIVVDTPPVLPVSDSIVLSSIIDGVVMIVGAETTKMPAAKEALSRMQSKNIDILGSVLSKGNRRTFKTYGKDYYYGYDKYYSGKGKAGTAG